VGHSEDGLASMRTHATAIRTTGVSAEGHHDDATVAVLTDATSSSGANGDADILKSRTADLGTYWLPWHIDSQFITLLTCDEYRDETTGARVPPPEKREGTGLIAMNRVGDVAAISPQLDEDVMLVQMGGFAQIYSGGILNACRHAVLRESADPGVTRVTYCSFWYAPWDLPCSLPPGRSLADSVNSGWNAMMDNTYVDITMRQSFQAFRDFFTGISVADEQDLDGRTASFRRLAAVVPLPSSSVLVASKQQQQQRAHVVVDILTDIRCPISHIALRRLAQAATRVSLEATGETIKTDRRVTFEFRYHPVFLNPNVPDEGEDLETYLLREHGISSEQARSPEYPIAVAGRAVGVEFNLERRVVNTLRAFCALEVAGQEGKAAALFDVLSQWYFEGAKDINDLSVLRAAAEHVEVSAVASAAEEGRSFEALLEEVRPRVEATYERLRLEVPRIPQVLVRDAVTGEGLELAGAETVEAYEAALQRVLLPKRSEAAGVSDLRQLPGMRVPGYGGEQLWLPHADPRSCVSLHARSRKGWFAGAWPYKESDFSREDESPDTYMYAEPRLVTHLDADSLGALSETYGAYFGAAHARLGGSRPLALLDTCASWLSHYPQDVLDGARVAVQGLNEKELLANKQATERLVRDLNEDPSLPYEDASFDFVTNVASIGYLTKPRDFFREVHRVLKPGGVAIIAFSNRCFASKATSVWLRDISAGAALSVIASDYLHFGAPEGEGWADITSIDISPKMTAGGQPTGDPMWVVTAVK